MRPHQTAFDALGMRDYIWRYPRGSYIQERWFDLGNPGLKSKIEGVRNQRHNELGCNDASLYRRFHQAGLTKVKMFPQLAIFTPATDGPRLGDVQDRFLHILDAEELEEFRGALQQALEDRSFFVAEWFHCAVGTNPG